MTRSLCKLFLLPAAVLALLSAGCQIPVDSVSSDLLGTDFISFTLDPAYNPGLPSVIDGRISESGIILEYPGFYIPQFYWIASFETEAVSVEINGQVQESGVTMNDFSSLLNYVVTSDAGDVREFPVSLETKSTWNMVAPFSPYPEIVRSPVGGFINSVTPWVLFQREANGFLYWRYFTGYGWDPDPLDPLAGGVSAGAVTEFDAVGMRNEIWTAYEDTTFPNQIQVARNNGGGWNPQPPLPVTGAAEDINILAGMDGSIYVSWIDDAGNERWPVVWKFLGGAWEFVGGGPVGAGHARTFKAAATGTGVIAACVFEENPDSISSFTYDGGGWNRIGTPSDMNREVEIEGLYYHTEEQVPVAAFKYQSESDPGFYNLDWMYRVDVLDDWILADTLSLSSYSAAVLSTDWFGNMPFVAAGDSVYEWDEQGWHLLGYDTFTDTRPNSLSLSATDLNARMVAFRDETAGGFLTVKIIQ